MEPHCRARLLSREDTEVVVFAEAQPKAAVAALEKRFRDDPRLIHRLLDGSGDLDFRPISLATGLNLNLDGRRIDVGWVRWSLPDIDVFDLGVRLRTFTVRDVQRVGDDLLKSLLQQINGFLLDLGGVEVQGNVGHE